MNSMKYLDPRQDTNYEELENSIVDSLSEISTASNIQLNPYTQEIINRNITDVISSYLWSSSLSQSRQNNLDFNDSKKNKKYRSIDSEYERQVKHAWEPESKNSLMKKDEKIITNNSTKISVPALDFSGLSENSKQVKYQEENKTDEFLNKKDKNLSKQKTIESSIYTIKTDSKQITNDSKSKISDSNFKKNEYQTHSSIKLEIENLLKDLKLYKNLNQDSSEYYNQENETKLNKSEFDKLNLMAINLKDLLSRLLEKRKIAKRNIIVEKMTREEIQAEKIDTQKELLGFEEKHGRPQTKLEKDLMRPLYDHYRKVKRILSKYTSAKGVGDMHSDENLVGDDEELNHVFNKDQKHFLNLHSFSLNELIKEKELTIQEKTKLKELIKKYENEFSKTTGRALTKEDREYHKEDFEKYKILKAKLKLIEALMEKQDTNLLKK